MSDLRYSLNLSFDDILLLPSYSEVLPAEVSTATLLAKDLKMNIPLVSAAMDTVTENELAAVMAHHGGFGVIHKNMSIQEQAFQVERVKKSESGMILDPITIGPEDPVSSALDLMSKYRISGVPVVVEGRKLVGILTNRDLRFEVDVKQPIKNVMTKENLVTVKEGISLNEAKKILQEHRIEKLLVVDKKKQLTGLITIKDIKKATKFPQANKDSSGRLFVGAAVSVSADVQDRLEALVSAGVDLLVVDSAHGHSKNVLKLVSYISKKYPNVIIVGGNVCTSDGVKALAESGADVVKVGVGPGSICTTRIVTGVGRAQASAILECSKMAQKMGVTIIADGGIRYSGDITKALAMGANMVMMGGLFAGVAESPGETVLFQGRSYKVYRGMGSVGAMKEGKGSRYFQEHVKESSKLIPEGIEGRVPYKGPAGDLIYQMVGGLKSAMGYLGVSSLKELNQLPSSRVTQITSGALRESHVHSVQVTREAPNYSV